MLSNIKQPTIPDLLECLLLEVTIKRMDALYVLAHDEQCYTLV